MKKPRVVKSCGRGKAQNQVSNLRDEDRRIRDDMSGKIAEMHATQKGVDGER